MRRVAEPTAHARLRPFRRRARGACTRVRRSSSGADSITATVRAVTPAHSGATELGTAKEFCCFRRAKTSSYATRYTPTVGTAVAIISPVPRHSFRTPSRLIMCANAPRSDIGCVETCCKVFATSSGVIMTDDTIAAPMAAVERCASVSSRAIVACVFATGQDRLLLRRTWLAHATSLE